jgi:hypothetical protein
MMNYDPNKHSEVVFHVKEDHAKVINFKNIPDWYEIGELIGSENRRKYIVDSTSFLLKPTDPVQQAPMRD